MTYEEALAFWLGRMNYEIRTPRPGDLKLERMRALMHGLGDPQDQLRIVHIAGSKGKGSTAAMLAAILRQAGYRTGLFTSPHLTDVEERIQVDGAAIARDELAGCLTQVARVVHGPRWDSSDAPTFFEVATAAGFLHFAQKAVDVAVLEVGLGGRLDATNICRPLVSVITSISLDHTQQLGDTLALIAREKAGIIKHGRPVVSGVKALEARAVIEEVARRENAPLREIGSQFSYRHDPANVGGTVVPPRLWLQTGRDWPAMELGLLGAHQAANAAVAVASVEELRAQGMHVADQAVADGLRTVNWPARLEILAQEPFVVLDCAHNVASVQALADTLDCSFPASRRLLIFGSSSDKDVAGMIDVLADTFSHAYLTRYASSPRSVSPERLAELWSRHARVPHTPCASAPDAWQAARAAARPEDLICVTGSVFLAGELRPLLMGNAQQG